MTAQTIDVCCTAPNSAEIVHGFRHNMAAKRAREAAAPSDNSNIFDRLKGLKR